MEYEQSSPSVNPSDSPSNPATTEPAPATSKPSWRDVLVIHPACQIIPTNSPESASLLRESVATLGIQVRVVTWSATEGGAVSLLDGRSRLDAAEAVGLDIININDEGALLCVPHQHIVGGDPYEISFSLNVHRRHLLSEQKKALGEELLKRFHTWSDRRVATMVGLDHKTISCIRIILEARGEIPHVETRIDTAKRRQPAKKSKKSITKTDTKNEAVETITPPKTGMAASTAPEVIPPKNKATTSGMSKPATEVAAASRRSPLPPKRTPVAETSEPLGWVTELFHKLLDAARKAKTAPSRSAAESAISHWATEILTKPAG
jgi:hypothetical protein